MPRLALTDGFVMGAKAKDAPQVDYFDEHTPGLALRVSEGGTRAWSFLFTSPKDGKRARASLGTYPGTSLASARTKAEEARGWLEESPPRDPRDVFAAMTASTITVSNLFDSWSEKRLAKLRSAEHIRRRMRRNVIPAIGSIALPALARRDINRVIDAILKREAAIEANRVFENLRAMLRWAVERGDLDHSPMDGMKKPSDENARERTLTDEEIATIWQSLPSVVAKSKDVQRIAKLCLVTGQRVGEVAGMADGELDIGKRLWSLPGSRSKNANPHAVPLSDMALAIVKDALRDAGETSKHVFPSDDGGIRPRAVTRTLSRAQKATKDKPKGKFDMPEWTPHDLRRTVLTNLAQLGVQPIVIGSIANHLSVTKANVTFANYVQYDYAKEKREALDLWAKRLEGIIGGAAKVLPMRRKSRAGVK
jgi:integrase